MIVLDHRIPGAIGHQEVTDRLIVPLKLHVIVARRIEQDADIRPELVVRSKQQGVQPTRVQDNSSRSTIRVECRTRCIGKCQRTGHQGWPGERVASRDDYRTAADRERTGARDTIGECGRGRDIEAAVVNDLARAEGAALGDTQDRIGVDQSAG